VASLPKLTYKLPRERSDAKRATSAHQRPGELVRGTGTCGRGVVRIASGVRGSPSFRAIEIQPFACPVAA
jgi:hypothetical protein